MHPVASVANPAAGPGREVDRRADTEFGRKLMPALFDHGLVDVGGSMDAPFVSGGGEWWN